MQSDLTPSQKTVAHRRNRIVACLDEMERARRGAETLTGLLETCGESQDGQIDCELVGESAALLRGHLERLHRATRCLEELLRR